MARDDPFGPLPDGALYCDLTQSWSAHGGGVGTYIRRKRRHILDHSAHRHLVIIPGGADRTMIDEGGRAITVTIASPRVPGSPNYRLLLRNRAVRAALAEHRPDLIECQDAYNLPWAALAHRRAAPGPRWSRLTAPIFRRSMSSARCPKLAAPVGALRRADQLRLCRVALSPVRRGVRDERAWRRGQAALAGGRSGRVVPLGAELGEFSPAKRCSEACAPRLGWPTTSR